MDFENEVLSRFAWKYNVLVHKDSGLRVKRPRIGYVAIDGKLFKASDVIGVLLREKRDGRISSSMEMARSFPDLKIAKLEALALGLTIYRTGRKCKRDHHSWRFISNGACLECCGKLSKL